MRARTLDADGDMTFGSGSANFAINTPDGVGQCILTRIKLARGEWFLDKTQGTDWAGRILGRSGKASYDAEIRRVILGTQGVSQITAYSSSLNDRRLTISATVLTQYSTQPVTVQASYP